MAQLNITLDQGEILGLLGDDTGDAVQGAAGKLPERDTPGRVSRTAARGAVRTDPGAQRQQKRRPRQALDHQDRHHRPQGPEAQERPLQDARLFQLPEKRGGARDDDGRDGRGRSVHGQGRARDEARLRQGLLQAGRVGGLQGARRGRSRPSGTVPSSATTCS